MRVLIDATYARRAPRSGTGVYIRMLLGELRRLGGIEPIAVADPRRRPPAGGGAGSARNLARDAWWLSAALPALARRHRAQLIHHPLPARSLRCPLPQVVTVHDLAFERLPEAFAPGFRRYARLVHAAAARRAAAVVCVSEATAADVRALWRVAAERIVVAPLGPGQFERAGRGAEEAAAPRHFLYVGDDEPRKDLDTLLDAYGRYRARASAPLQLVLAGRAERPAGPGVRAVRSPDAAALRELHRRAAALVHPSRHEGFGLTPLEAMALGTPVLAARCEAVAEVCSEAARYVPPGDAEALASALAELGGDPALRAALRERGLARAAAFSWAACARAHLDAYSLALT
jgi:glycosyltransferase involved in cell wall biosynthesis